MSESCADEISVINPGTLECVGTFLPHSNAELQAKFALCQSAQRDWALKPLVSRQQIMQDVLELLRRSDNQNELAYAITGRLNMLSVLHSLAELG
jgi:acyl-CoA reductase-like NAD-dependent aldehyde dehydrogenase